MNHKEMRKESRLAIKGNLFRMWLPFIISFLIQIPFLLMIGKICDDGSVLEQVLSYISSLLLMPLTVGAYKYYLDQLREGNTSIKTVFSYFNSFATILVVALFLTIATILGTVLLIVPGIIISLMYSQVFYIMVDNPSYGPIKCLRESRLMMKGHKWNFFVFNIKFIGWILLGSLTLFLGYVYIIPYISMAQTNYYENLKKIYKN